MCLVKGTEAGVLFKILHLTISVASYRSCTSQKCPRKGIVRECQAMLGLSPAYACWGAGAKCQKRFHLFQQGSGQETCEQGVWLVDG